VTEAKELCQSAGPVAVLYQAALPPPVDGIQKPMKPGGYSDSGADISFTLRSLGIPVFTPQGEPDPGVALDWVVPDTDEGIQRAVNAGSRVLWANTVLFETHPLSKVRSTNISVVGQCPDTVQRFDNKWLSNQHLRSNGCWVAPAFLAGREAEGEVVAIRDLTLAAIESTGLGFPLVAKPVRGRGSEGVRKVNTLDELKSYGDELLSATVEAGGARVPKYGKSIIVEQFLAGVEVTVTVMPPGEYVIAGAEKAMDSHWCLPPVKRFNHEDGIAPYNGIVAVVRNSLRMNEAEAGTPVMQELLYMCSRAAALVGALAPIRIDCRAGHDGTMVLFDLNMKPNMTGPGRPGREDQDSLTSIAARGIGWSYSDLLMNMLLQAWPTA
jgi:D-alanine-D-alanine ligase